MLNTENFNKDKADSPYQNHPLHCFRQTDYCLVTIETQVTRLFDN